jgi:fructosamine-3-kinase
MSPPTSPELTWDALRALVRDWRGTAVDLEEVRELQGGITCATLLLIATDGQRAVAKLSHKAGDDDCVREARHLRYLRQLGLPAPEVYSHRPGTPDAPLSHLLLEFREGVDLYEAQRRCDEEEWDGLMAQMGELMSTLHSVTGERFGPMDGGEGMFSSWAEYFRARFEPLVREVQAVNVLGAEELARIEQVRDTLDTLLADVGPPRLIHGDPWGNNMLAARDESGRWRITALLDPHLRFEHPEAEVSRMDVAKLVNPAFMAAYERACPLPPEYQQRRRWIYRLYYELQQIPFFAVRRRQLIQTTLGRLTP